MVKIQKSLSRTKKFRDLMKRIDEANEDPGFREFVREFTDYHSGRHLS
jgi:hypothetical protein